MEYPVIIDGEKAGVLRVERRGLLTEFRAVVEGRHELLRLSVYGEGREGYLGVAEPRGKGMLLERRLSRGAMAGFPSRIEYAGRSGQSGQESAKPEERPPEPEAGDTLWYRLPDGTLTAFEGGRLLLALPAGDLRLPRGSEGVAREIDGVVYVVFPR